MQNLKTNARKNSTDNNDQLNNKEKIELKNDLKHFGYLLPTNDEELEEFEKVHHPSDLS
jgi:hypothetical protein